MSTILERLFEAADNHGSDSGEPDHTVGDLQGLVTRAWALMSLEQKHALLDSIEVDALVSDGAREEYDVAHLQAELREKHE